MPTDRPCVRACPAHIIGRHAPRPKPSVLFYSGARAMSILADARSEMKTVRTAMNCCVRCAMRYAGIKDITAYQLSEEELEAAMSAGDEEADTAPEADPPAVESNAKSSVCPLCLGCLQQCVQPSAIAAVADVVRSSGHELRDFSLAVSCLLYTSPSPRDS